MVEFRADVSLVDSQGRTALEAAKAAGAPLSIRRFLGGLCNISDEGCLLEAGRTPERRSYKAEAAADGAGQGGATGVGVRGDGSADIGDDGGGWCHLGSTLAPDQNRIERVSE